MSIVSWFVDSCRSFISSEGTARRYFHMDHASTNTHMPRARVEPRVFFDLRRGKEVEIVKVTRSFSPAVFISTDFAKRNLQEKSWTRVRRVTERMCGSDVTNRRIFVPHSAINKAEKRNESAPLPSSWCVNFPDVKSPENRRVEEYRKARQSDFTRAHPSCPPTTEWASVERKSSVKSIGFKEALLRITTVFSFSFFPYPSSRVGGVGGSRDRNTQKRDDDICNGRRKGYDTPRAIGYTRN